MVNNVPSAGTVDAVMNPPRRVRAISQVMGAIGDGLDPVIDAWRPYVDGLELLPRDGRFLLVGNHTQVGVFETMLIPYFVRRELGVRVRPLAERELARMGGLGGDVLAAFGAVVGHPDTATELMQHNETVLVFPGGGREMPKFKGEQYQLRWERRSGFARVAIANDYPIVPVGLVGSDDMYRGAVTRDSRVGRMLTALSSRMSGRADMVFPPIHGVGPTLIPRPERMYLRFGKPIDTTQPTDLDAGEWEAAVKERTQTELEGILSELQLLRTGDPYRNLNPLGWRDAVRA